jgi:hypothetical protein
MTLIRIALVAAALAVFGGALVLTQSGQDLFQQALVKERADGDLRAAIVIYQRIVRDFSADRTLAATALVQIGRCYDRLGQADAGEARKAYASSPTRGTRWNRRGRGSPRGTWRSRPQPA